jgi:hypothetical protein
MLSVVSLWLLVAALPQGVGASSQQGQAIAPSTQSPARDATTADKKGTGIIKGRVVTADGGRPLRRVQITASSAELSESRNVSTSAQGLFELKELPAGRYTVSASRAGFLRLQYGQRRPGESGRPLQLADGQSLDRIDFALPRMSVISGRITDEIGEPLAGVTVFAMQAKYFRGRKRMVPAGGGMVRTDDTGEYRLIALEPGEYYVMGTTRDTWTVDGDDKQRVGFGPTFYTGTLVVANAHAITVGLGQEVSGIDFGMVPGRVATISGTAMSASGVPLAGESVDMAQEFAGPTNSSVFGFGGGKVAADGSFTIRDVSPGEYRISVRSPGDRDRPGEAATMLVSVAGADLDGVSLVTGAGGTVSGRVATDEGVPPPLGGSALGSGRLDSRMRVFLRPQEPDTTPQRFTQDNGRLKDDGTFEVTDAIGANRISISPLPSGWAVKSIEYDGKDYADLPIELRNGQKIDGLTIVISNKLPTLGGRLLDEKGLPAEGTVVLFPDDSAKWSEQSRLVKTVRPDPSGAFEIRLVPPGDYLIAPLDYVQNGSWDDPDFLNALQEKATKVSVREGSPAPVNLTLRKEETRR